MKIAAASLAAVLLAGPALAATKLSKPSDMLAWTPAEQAIGFRTIEKSFATHVVRRGAHVRALLKSSSALNVSFDYDHVTYTTKSYMAADRVSGVLVIKDGRIMLERYALGRTAHDRWTSFSVAKSVTSTLIGAAVRDGYIKSLDDPVVRYLPEMAGSAYDEVSVRNLLTMSSGVRWTEAYGNSTSDVVRIGSFVPPAGIDPIAGFMRTLPQVAAPGTQFHYKSGEADLAAVLVARATGKSAADYLSEKIWRPFGMERDAIWIVDSAGAERGGCCLSMTLRDYGRFGLFMQEGGVANGKAVLPDGWIEKSTTTQISTGQPGGGYGYMWWIGPDGYRAAGIFGQTIAVFPADKVIVVVNSAWPTPGSRDTGARQGAFINAAHAAAIAAR